jgi:hypothetical protein
MYGYESPATVTADRLRYKLQTILSSERTPQDEEQRNCQAKERKKENLAMGPKGVPNTKIERPTDRGSHQQLNSCQLYDCSGV